MLSEDYVISIEGKQRYEGDTGVIKVDTVGSYTKKNGTRYISYKEYEDGNPDTATTAVLKIEDDRVVTLSRAGSRTRLILEKGCRHNCLYDTDFGPLNMGVFTSLLKNELTDQGGCLKIRYTLDIDSNLSSRNELSIIVREGGSEKKRGTKNVD